MTRGGKKKMSVDVPMTSMPGIVTPISGNGISDAKAEEIGEQKARKACINCRKQKMKCRIDNGGKTCRRCYRAGVPCIFVPRANAAGLPSSASQGERSQGELNKDILQRLQVIEDHLGFGVAPSSAETAESFPASVGPGRGSIDVDEVVQDGQTPLSIWDSLQCLRRACSTSVHSVIWQSKTVTPLWEAFHDRMPGLHFLHNHERFSSPHPLLLATMLYCSSLRGDAEVSVLAPQYFLVLSNAIAQLSIPDSALGEPPADPNVRDQWAFQTVLGIVIAGLLSEAARRETGIWISIAYRLMLEHCPSHMDERSHEWRALFSGVQIVDLEHASLHLSCPVIPIEAPLPTLQLSHRDHLYRLSRMMHTGLTHFTGRGLPTIWSYFITNPQDIASWSSTFTSVDAAVIRDWARQLDECLVEFSNEGHDSEEDRKLVFRQYILHRLTVLSIYHPARGFNLYATGVTPKEQYELLLSARATVKLHLNDTSIWANWDLIMITWACLIVIQGIEGGAGEPDDLRDINLHLNLLRQTNEPKPGLRDKLISRLDKSLSGMQTPVINGFADPMTMAGVNANLDLSWHLFDQSSLEQLIYPSWPDPTHLQPRE